MAHSVIFRPEALDDLTEAFQWYQERQPGLGAEFMAAVEEKLNQVATSPKQYQQIRGPIRRAITQHFPYGIFFIESSDRITVIAVMHHARHPRHWRKPDR